MQEEQVTIDDLPDDILAIIVGQDLVGSSDSFVRRKRQLQLVCKRWRDVFSDPSCWRAFSLVRTSIPSKETVLRMVQQLRFVEHLRLIYCCIEYLDEFLEGLSETVTHATFHGFILKTSKMPAANLYYSSYSRYVSAVPTLLPFKHLRYIELNNRACATIHLRHLFKHCSAELEEVRLTAAPVGQELHVVQCHNLRRLFLQGCSFPNELSTYQYMYYDQQTQRDQQQQQDSEESDARPLQATDLFLNNPYLAEITFLGGNTPISFLTAGSTLLRLTVSQIRLNHAQVQQVLELKQQLLPCIVSLSVERIQRDLFEGLLQILQRRKQLQEFRVRDYISPDEVGPLSQLVEEVRTLCTNNSALKVVGLPPVKRLTRQNIEFLLQPSSSVKLFQCGAIPSDLDTRLLTLPQTVVRCEMVRVAARRWLDIDDDDDDDDEEEQQQQQEEEQQEQEVAGGVFATLFGPE